MASIIIEDIAIERPLAPVTAKRPKNTRRVRTMGKVVARADGKGLAGTTHLLLRVTNRNSFELGSLDVNDNGVKVSW